MNAGIWFRGEGGGSGENFGPCLHLNQNWNCLGSFLDWRSLLIMSAVQRYVYGWKFAWLGWFGDQAFLITANERSEIIGCAMWQGYSISHTISGTWLYSQHPRIEPDWTLDGSPAARKRHKRLCMSLLLKKLSAITPTNNSKQHW